MIELKGKPTNPQLQLETSTLLLVTDRTNRQKISQDMEH
jgi:hypothetical protein